MALFWLFIRASFNFKLNKIVTFIRGNKFISRYHVSIKKLLNYERSLKTQRRYIRVASGFPFFFLNVPV